MSKKDDRSLAIKVAGAVLMSVPCVAVMLRCYVRGWVVKAFGWDDGLMVLSAVLHVICIGIMIASTFHGAGKKFKLLTENQHVTAIKYWYISGLFYSLAIYSCRISLCIFLRRVTVKPIHTGLVYMVMLFTVVVGMFILVQLLQCRPIDYTWLRTSSDTNIEGNCFSLTTTTALMYLFAGSVAVCDLVLATLPIFIVRNLQMDRQTKIAAMVMLSMTCIVTAAALLIRIPLVKTIENPEILYASVDISLWSNTETTIGITAGSLATLGPLLRSWFGFSSQPDDSPSPIPGRSRLRRRRGTIRTLSFPLGSIMNHTVQSRLRPDKHAVALTTVQAQQCTEEEARGSGDPNSSQERLTTEQYRGGTEGSSEEMVLRIHQTFEVTRSSTPSMECTRIKEQV